MGSKFRYFGLWQASKRRSWRWAQPVVIIIITGNQPLPNDSLAPFKKYSHTHWCAWEWWWPSVCVCLMNVHQFLGPNRDSQKSPIDLITSWLILYRVSHSGWKVKQPVRSFSFQWSWQIALTFPNSVQFICPLSFPLTDWTYYRCAASSFQSWCQANWWLSPKWSCQCYKIWKRKGIRDSTPPTWFRTLMCLWP